MVHCLRLHNNFYARYTRIQVTMNRIPHRIYVSNSVTEMTRSQEYLTIRVRFLQHYLRLLNLKKTDWISFVKCRTECKPCHGAELVLCRLGFSEPGSEVNSGCKINNKICIRPLASLVPSRVSEIKKKCQNLPYRRITTWTSCQNIFF